MTCEESRRFKDAYLDEQLDLAHLTEIDEHLKNCYGCSEIYDNLRQLSRVVRSNDLYFKAPAHLRRSVQKSLRSETRYISLRQWFRFVFPSAVVASIAILSMLFWDSRSMQKQIVREITSSHIRSLLTGHVTEVTSSDQHTVKPWFDGKLDYAPTVVDLKERGFPLMGGRLDYVQSRPVAALVYQRGKHVINLFLWPAPDGLRIVTKNGTYQGYNVVHWKSSGMNCWAVSDLNAEELRKFSEFWPER